MWISKVVFVLIVFVAHSCYSQQLSDQQCRDVKDQCIRCERSLGRSDKDNLVGNFNRVCEWKIGRKYVWRKLDRCDCVELLCKGLVMNCEEVALKLGLPRRLP